MKGTNAITIRVPMSMIVTSENWHPSTTGAYKFVNILHKFGESTNAVRWDAGATGVTPPIQGADNWPLYYVATVYNTMSNGIFLFNYARVLGADITIEWLGSLTTKQGANRTADETGDTTVRADLEVTKFGTTLLAKVCHERYDRNHSDNQNQVGLAPMNMFGWDRLPVINNPDMMTSIDARGTTPSGNLKGAPGVKMLRFTPEKRIHTLKYKPLNRLDKAGAFFDLVKLQAAGANWDDDMRSGTLWLGQEIPLVDVAPVMWPEQNPVPLLNNTSDFFRITYNVNLKFFGQSKVGQDNPVVP